MKAWLRKRLLNLLDDGSMPSTEPVRPRYAHFECRHEFKILDAENGGHVIILADNSYRDIVAGREPLGKVYIVPENEKIGDVVTTMLVERKLSK